MTIASRSSAPIARAARWFLLAGLAVVGVGCTGETPSNTPPIPESEKGVVRKAEEGAVEIGQKVEGAVGSAAQATGGAIKDAGVKLETSAAESVKANVGETAGKAVESIGKGMEKAGDAVGKGGDKLKEAAKP